jgi:signal peptidase I
LSGSGPLEDDLTRRQDAPDASEIGPTAAYGVSEPSDVPGVNEPVPSQAAVDPYAPTSTFDSTTPYDPATFEETSSSFEPASIEGPAEPIPGFSHADAAVIVPAVGGTSTSPELRLELDDRTTVIMQRLNVWKDELVAWFKTLASAAVYATLIVTFGFQVARVEGQSMAPTLADQDRLIVNKLAYRMGEPRRGDIVMLYYPLNPDKSFVKRVIAEEGDQVRIVDGRVYVNDVPMGDDFVPPEYRSHDDFGPTVIPEGYYFVLGDHRNNSSDSRHWGMVPKKYIIGRVQLRWWPIPTARVF